MFGYLASDGESNPSVVGRRRGVHLPLDESTDLDLVNRDCEDLVDLGILEAIEGALMDLPRRAPESHVEFYGGAPFLKATITDWGLSFADFVSIDADEARDG